MMAEEPTRTEQLAAAVEDAYRAMMNAVYALESAAHQLPPVTSLGPQTRLRKLDAAIIRYGDLRALRAAWDHRGANWLLIQDEVDAALKGVNIASNEGG